MPGSTAAALFDVALYSSTAKAIPYSQGPSSLPGFDSHHTWDSVNKSHVTQGLPLTTVALSTYSVSGNVVTLTATAPLTGAVANVNYVTVLVSDGNTWLNGTYLLSAVNVGGNPNRFNVVIVHADGSGSVAGTAKVNPQTASLGTHKDGDGTDLCTVGPLGSLVLSGQPYNESSLLDIRQTSTQAPAMMRFFINGFPDTPRAYFPSNASFYTISEIVSSARTNGLPGLGFRILPPIDDPFMIGTAMDVGIGFAVRDSGLTGSMAYLAVDQNARYKWAVMASDAKQWWGDTASKDINGTPLFDTNLYRTAAGKLATDSIFTLNVRTGQAANALEVRDVAASNALRYFIDSNGNPTINNANSRLTLGATNNAYLAHDGFGATLACVVGSLVISSAANYSMVAAGREAIKVQDDGTKPRVSLAVAPTVTPDAYVPTGQVNLWVDEVANKIMFKVRYSNGATVKSGEVALA